MGMVLGSKADRQIISVLNNWFSSAGIAALRQHHAQEDLFDNRHTLKRVACRLGAHPTNSTKAEKWYGLLDFLPAATVAAIKNALEAALVNQDGCIDGVVFDVTLGAGQYSLYPTNATAPERIPTSATHYIYYLLLICPGDYNGLAVAAPGPDGGVNEVALPTPPFLATLAKGPAAKGRRPGRK